MRAATPFSRACSRSSTATTRRSDARRHRVPDGRDARRPRAAAHAPARPRGRAQRRARRRRARADVVARGRGPLGAGAAPSSRRARRRWSGQPPLPPPRAAARDARRRASSSSAAAAALRPTSARARAAPTPSDRTRCAWWRRARDARARAPRRSRATAAPSGTNAARANGRARSLFLARLPLSGTRERRGPTARCSAVRRTRTRRSSTRRLRRGRARRPRLVDGALSRPRRPNAPIDLHDAAPGARAPTRVWAAREARLARAAAAAAAAIAAGGGLRRETLRLAAEAGRVPQRALRARRRLAVAAASDQLQRWAFREGDPFVVVAHSQPHLADGRRRDRQEGCDAPAAARRARREHAVARALGDDARITAARPSSSKLDDVRAQTAGARSPGRTRTAQHWEAVRRPVRMPGHRAKPPAMLRNRSL